MRYLIAALGSGIIFGLCAFGTTLYNVGRDTLGIILAFGGIILIYYLFVCRLFDFSDKKVAKEEKKE